MLADIEVLQSSFIIFFSGITDITDINLIYIDTLFSLYIPELIVCVLYLCVLNVIICELKFLYQRNKAFVGLLKC